MSKPALSLPSKRRCIGCGMAPIPGGHLACRTCWFRLPLDVRQRVKAPESSVYVRAAIDAVAWFRANPRAVPDGE